MIVQLIDEILDQNDGSRDGAVLDQPRSKSKGKRKAANWPTSSLQKAMKLPWTLETVELPLKYMYIKEYKTKCEFSGVDFEAMASGFRSFVGRHSPRDNPTHVKEGYLMTLLLYKGNPSGRVTLLPCKQVLRSKAFHRFKKKEQVIKLVILGASSFVVRNTM